MPGKRLEVTVAYYIRRTRCGKHRQNYRNGLLLKKINTVETAQAGAPDDGSNEGGRRWYGFRSQRERNIIDCKRAATRLVPPEKGGLSEPMTLKVSSSPRRCGGNAASVPKSKLGFHD